MIVGRLVDKCGWWWSGELGGVVWSVINGGQAWLIRVRCVRVSMSESVRCGRLSAGRVDF